MCHSYELILLTWVDLMLIGERGCKKRGTSSIQFYDGDVNYCQVSKWSFVTFCLIMAEYGRIKYYKESTHTLCTFCYNSTFSSNVCILWEHIDFLESHWQWFIVHSFWSDGHSWQKTCSVLSRNWNCEKILNNWKHICQNVWVKYLLFQNAVN